VLPAPPNLLLVEQHIRPAEQANRSDPMTRLVRECQGQLKERADPSADGLQLAILHVRDHGPTGTFLLRPRQPL
jgi:hypothetical protein